MVARFVVRVGRRWRELDLVSGRVSGLGDVSLVRVRRGRLEVVPRAPALRALRTLLTAGSKRSAAKDGPRLSQIRYPVNRRSSKGRLERQTDGHKKAPPVHTCCQQHHYPCNTDANFNSILKPPTSTVGVQCSGQTLATKTLNIHTDRVIDQTEEIHTTSQSQRVKDQGNEKLQNNNHNSEEPKDHGGERVRRRTLLGRKRQTQESVSSVNSGAAVSEVRRTQNSRREPEQAEVSNNLNQVSLSSDSEFESGIGKNKLHRNKGTGRKGVRRTDYGSEGRRVIKKRIEMQEGPCKELLISEETVMLLRGFIERDQRNVFGVDLELYDTDDAYKAQFFYRLNPLVGLERCPQIGRMLRERASQADTVSLKDFITKLGLRSVAESSAVQSRYRMRRRGDVTARRRARSERDRGPEERERGRKDNKLTTDHPTEPAPSHTKPNTSDSSRKELKQVVAVASNGGERGKRPSKPSTGKQARKREYSHEEDAFIVRWVRGEGRATLVNGNLLWTKLQPQYHAATGCFRSWHSLRNRYLRYLLPALGSLPLPPTEAARLRAAAATGSLKARKQPARRNSAFQQPPVRSAWARRPRPAPPPRRTALVSDTEETPKRTLRSDAAPAHTADRTPPAHAHAFTRTPTYSQLTERFARRRRSPPDARRSRPIRYSSDSDGSLRSELDSDADSSSSERTTSGRRDAGADRGGSNKRKRIASRDSDADPRSTKRRRSTRLDTGARAHRERQNGGTEQAPGERSSTSLDSDTDAPLYSRSNSEKSVDKGGRSESGQRANKSDPRRDKRGRFSRTTDRQHGGERGGSARGGGERDSTHAIRQRLSADQIMSKDYQNGGKSDRNGRHAPHAPHASHAPHARRTRRLYNHNAM